MMLVATNTLVASYTVRSDASHSSGGAFEPGGLGRLAIPFTFSAMLPTAGTVAWYPFFATRVNPTTYANTTARML